VKYDCVAVGFSCTFQLRINSAISVYVFCRTENGSLKEK
jgi:hypothetical protein